MSQARDERFETLALPELDLVYRVARRLTRSEHEAEDLVQETYLKAYKSFCRFELRDYGIKPWLLKIMHNTHLNRRQRDARAPRATDQQVLEEAHADETPALGSDGAPPKLDYERMDQEVKQAIDALSEDFRTVLLLWATMELSYQEIADALEVPIGTVMSRLHRARGQLTRALEDYAREQRLTRE